MAATALRAGELRDAAVKATAAAVVDLERFTTAAPLSLQAPLEAAQDQSQTPENRITMRFSGESGGGGI
jgi:hypothetical protein